MATIRKRGSSWAVEVRKRGVTRRATWPTKRQAEAWATQIEAEIIAGTMDAPGHVTVAEVLQRYAAEVSPAKRGARWEIVRLEAWADRLPFAGDRIADVAASDIAAWRDARLREVSPGTVAREMNLLGSVLEITRREWCLIKVNPLRDVAKPPRPRARDRVFSDDEARRACLALGYDGGPAETKSQVIAVVFLLALESAMRLGEIVSLEWGQVFLDRRFVRLLKTKNGDTRDVPLSRRAVELFDAVRQHERPFPVSRDVCSTLFARALRDAGIEGATFHDSRATSLTRLAGRFSVLELARISGHRDLRSLQVYYRESAEVLASKLD